LIGFLDELLLELGMMMPPLELGMMPLLLLLELGMMMPLLLLLELLEGNISYWSCWRLC
jgi:hypothetical protein